MRFQSKVTMTETIRLTANTVTKSTSNFLMFIPQVAAFMTIYTLVGPDWSFKPASYQASTRWTVMQFVVIGVTAIIAGLICAIIAKGGKAPLALAAVVLVLGFGLAVLGTTL